MGTQTFGDIAHPGHLQPSIIRLCPHTLVSWSVKVSRSLTRCFHPM